MKKLFCLMLPLMFLSIDSHAFTLTCSTHQNHAVFFEGGFQSRCNADYSVKVEGIIGGGFFGVVQDDGKNSGIIIQCPFLKNPVGTYHGVDFHVGILVAHGSIALFKNFRKGICYIVGAGIGGIGGSLFDAKLTIKRDIKLRHTPTFGIPIPIGYSESRR